MSDAIVGDRLAVEAFAVGVIVERARAGRGRDHKDG
jgi:hypothetical protein